MTSRCTTMAACIVALALASTASAGDRAHKDDRGKLYQTVISRNPEMAVINGRGEFTIRVRSGKARVYWKDTSAELKLVKTGNIFRAVDGAGALLLIFAVLDAGSHGTQLVYAHHADSNNSRARIGLTVGTLEETATLEDQRALLRERILNLGADPERVILVKSVAADSVSARTGLQFGDVIVRVGEFADPSPSQFQRTVFEAEPGSILALTVIRSGGEQLHELLMPATPDPIDTMTLEAELSRVLSTSW